MRAAGDAVRAGMLWCAALSLLSYANGVAAREPTAEKPKRAVCHIPPGNPAAAHTLQLPEPAVRAHLKHGDRVGACQITSTGKDQDSGAHDLNPDDAKKVPVCHIPPGNPAAAHTLQLPEPALRAHLKHGDKAGACESRDVDVQP